MIRNISVGIDIGSSVTRVVVGEFFKGEKGSEKIPKVIGVGEAPSLGMRYGYVADSDKAVSSLKKALHAAEQSSGIKIKSAFVAVSGATLRSEINSGLAIISKADGEVTELDKNKALEDCESNVHLNNKKVIHLFPLSYKLDGREVLGRLEGMHGTKLEVKALFVTYSVQHLEDLLSVVSMAGVKTLDIIAAPIAESSLILSEKQKIMGVAIVDIGYQTTSLSVFENGSLLSVHTFQIGSSDITNDIALGFKIPLETAESFKLGNITSDYSKKKLDEIIFARLSDIFEAVDNHLKKIKRSELLPAGIVFVGGGGNTFGLTEFSKAVLKLPSSIGTTEIFGNTKTKLRDSSWYTPLGLLLAPKDNNGYAPSSFGNFFKDIKSAIKSSIKQLMP